MSFTLSLWQDAANCNTVTLYLLCAILEMRIEYELYNGSTYRNEGIASRDVPLLCLPSPDIHAALFSGCTFEKQGFQLYLKHDHVR